MIRRNLLQALGLNLLALPAWANLDNKRPYKFIVGFAAGGGTDILARLVAKNFEDLSKVSSIVENKTGASGSIAANFVANSAPEQRNLLITSDSHLIYPYINAKANYDPIKDFTPIAGLAGGPQCLLTQANSPVNTIEDLITASQKYGADITYASGGAGTLTHMVVELLKSKTALKARHIPFRGSAPSVMPVIAGEINLLSSPLGMVLPHINSGKLKALAVTSKLRSPLLPNTPTVAETPGLQDYEASSWVGILGPQRMDLTDVASINTLIQKISQQPEFLTGISSNAWAPIRLNPSDFSAFIHKENAKWMELITKNKIDLE